MDCAGEKQSGQSSAFPLDPRGRNKRRLTDWLPVLGFFLLSGVWIVLDIQATFNPPSLLLVLNATFLCAVSLVVSILAAHSYFAGQGTSVLLLGCGALALGLGAVVAGLPPARNDPNYTATVYNLAALLASAFHLAGAAWGQMKKPPAVRPGGQLFIFLYPAVILLVVLGAAGARQRRIPVFFQDGTGATGINIAILWTAAGLFFVAALLLWRSYRESGTAFSRWYSLGLALLAAGLMTVSFQKNFGSPLNWTGRAAQYAAGIYMLTAVISAGKRDRNWTVSLKTALRQAEERYHSLVEVSPDSILIARGGKMAYANPAAVRLFGASSIDDLIGRSLSDLFLAGMPEKSEKMRALLRGAMTPILEGQIRRLDGVCRDVEISAAPFDDEAGSSIQMVLRDNTDRTQALEALRQSEQRYQVLSEATVEGIAISEQGRILDANEQLSRMLGYSRGELIDMEIALLLPPHERERVLENIRHNLEATTEHEVVRKDGKILTVEAHAKMLLYHGRSVRLTTIHDVTERKYDEEVLRKTAEELKRSNQDLEQFAYAASHDLQEPLRMISGFLQLLNEKYGREMDSKGKEYIHFAVEGSLRMSQLIRDLLEYSRVERKGHQLNPIDANRALALALANLSKSIQEASAEVQVQELPIVFGDPIQLSQLFQNLIGNAIKFRSPGKTCEIRIGAKRADDTWTFSVYDNGIGIDRRDHDRIFAIFQRLHSRSKYPGTGIGLALCKRIVERHGGHIWVDSKPGEGSVFHFTMRPAAVE